jgi:hypothetical protein
MSPIHPTALVFGVWLDPQQTAITAVDLGHISQAYAREFAASFRASFGRQLFR